MKKILLLSFFLFILSWCNQTKTPITTPTKTWNNTSINQNNTWNINTWNTQINTDKDTQEILNIMDEFLK